MLASMRTRSNPPNLRSALAVEIRILRQKRGVSQEELGFRCGIHRTYVSQLERSLKSPTVDVLARLADALGDTPSKLIARAEKRARDGVADE